MSKRPAGSRKHADRAARLRRQHGFSLLELSLSLVVLGLLSVVLVQLLGRGMSVREEARQRSLVERADDAVSGFVFGHWRLPCPDTDADGLEDCFGGAHVGSVPWRTIGLPDMRAGQLRYGVLRRPGLGVSDSADLAVAGDRFYPLLAEGSPPVAAALPLGNTNGLDLCHSLRNAARLAASSDSADFLHTSGPAGIRSVAYAIAVAGVDDTLDADNRSGNAIVAPSRLQIAGHDDMQRAVGAEQLWSRLHCGEALAGAGHAHANAASAAAMLSHALVNYVQVLWLQERMAGAAVASSAASVATAAGGVANATAATAVAIAKALLSQGALSGIIAAGALAVAANAVAVVSAAASVVKSAIALAAAIEARTEGQAQAASAQALAARLRANARAADAAGMY